MEWSFSAWIWNKLNNSKNTKLSQSLTTYFSFSKFIHLGFTLVSWLPFYLVVAASSFPLLRQGKEGTLIVGEIHYIAVLCQPMERKFILSFFRKTKNCVKSVQEWSNIVVPPWLPFLILSMKKATTWFGCKFDFPFQLKSRGN